MAFKTDNVIYFYEQNHTYSFLVKRSKRVVFNQASSSNENKSIAQRLSELFAGGDSSLGAYTDVRLNAIKELTDDMIEELQNFLIEYSDLKVQPMLSWDMIYELHSDWTDLTEKCTYKAHPLWQTKAGRDSTMKRSSEMSDKLGDKLHRDSRLDDIHKLNTPDHSKPFHPKAIQKRSSSKLKSITESEKSKSDDATRLGASLLTSHQIVKRISPVKSPQTNPTPSKTRLDTNISRTSGNTNVLLNYQLSNKAFKDNGWTVYKTDLEEIHVNNRFRIIGLLKSSLVNIEEVKEIDKRHDRQFPCKLVFYGDYKRNQINKYKKTNLQPKKSAFSMSLYRRELPKPLDINLIIATISNPFINANTLALSQDGSSVTFNKQIDTIKSPDFLSKSSHFLNPLESSQTQADLKSSHLLQYLPPPPPLLKSQTQDGTTCIYYPNGKVAIVLANVFGYSFESANQANHTNLNSALGSNFENLKANANLTFMTGSLNSSFIGASSTIMVNQSLKNSYTAIVYDNIPSESTPVVLALEPLSAEPTVVKPRTKPSKAKRGRLLAVINPTGTCVCYGPREIPRFICSQVSGMLCNSEGAVTRQWKWDECDNDDLDKLKKDLTVNLNDNLKLEYYDPMNIKLTFTFGKEQVSFDLSPVRENQTKIQDMLFKTASSVALKSRMGQQRISNMSKPPPQIHKNASGSVINRKSSVLSNQYSFVKDHAKDQEIQKIDKMLEATISFKDIPIMKDLLVLQKKIRTILEDWLVYCRTRLRILEPNKYLIYGELPLKYKSSRYNENHSDFNKIVFHRRKSKSAAMSSRRTLNIGAYESNLKTVHEWNHYVYNKHQFSSSPIKGSKNSKVFSSAKRKDMLNEFKEFNRKLAARFNTTNSELKNESATSFEGRDKFNRVHSIKTDLYQDPKAARSSTPVVLLKEDGAGSSVRRIPMKYLLAQDLHLQCPVILHNKIAFNVDNVTCRCSRHMVPLIKDLEFDFFLDILPEEQILVVTIIDSCDDSFEVKDFVQDLYYESNRNKLQPCKDSINDEFRYVYYDVRRALDDSDHGELLLCNRHNIKPGSILVFCNRSLIFGDSRFNGYGNSRKDFLKQLEKCKQDAKSRKYLPFDFCFK